MALLSIIRSIVLDAVRRLAATLAAYLMAGALMVAGVAFLTLAGYRALAHALGDITAGLIVGGAYTLVSLVVLLALKFSGR